MDLFLAAGALEPAEVTLLLLALGILLGLAKLLGEVARYFGQPSVLGEILAGVVLGPTLLGRFFPGLYEWLFPVHGGAFTGLETLITLAAVLLLLVAGLEVDLSSVWRQGKAMILVSIAGMAIPFALGFPLAWFGSGLLGLGADQEAMRLPFALFVGIALSITALPVIAKILIDLNVAKTDIGALILSSAMVNDLVGWIGFAIVLAMIAPVGDAAAGAGAGSVASTIVLTLIFIGAILTAGKFLAHRALPFIQAHTDWPGGVLVFVLSIALICAAFTEWLGIHSIFGAFIAGVAIGDSSHLRQRTREVIHEFITNIFAPLFFASIALRVSFIDAFNPMMVLIVLVVACIGKIGGCYLGAKLAGMAERESWAIGCGMVARGAMEIILGQLAYSHGLIGEELLVAIVIMALATSLIAGPAIRMLLSYQHKRNLAQLVSDKAFIPSLNATDNQQAIAELARIASPLTNSSAEEIFDSAWRRERIMATGLPNGLAVPHARLDELKQPVVVIGVSNEGIDFNAPDGSNAHLICLLLSPLHDPTAQLELLDIIARAFESEEARRLAIAANSYTEFLASLRISHKTTNGH